MTAEEFANQLRISFFPLTDEREIPFVGNLKGRDVAEMARFYAIKSCQSTIEELKELQRIILSKVVANIVINTRIHFYTQVITFLNK